MKLRIVSLLVAIGLVVAGFPLLGSRADLAAGPILVGRVRDSYNPNKGKIFVLVVGTDARHGNPDLRADAVHLVGINTKTMKGGILNFPRDSWVNIPGYGSARINEATVLGGPELLARTVESITGIKIDYWMMTGFEGFQGAVRDLGGVKMRIPTPVYDRGGSGAALRAGTYKLEGYQALAYARTRKAFSDGDIARTTNQARILIALLSKLRTEVTKSPAALLRWMAAAKEHTRFDLTPDEMFRLGVLASEVKPKDVGNVTVPVSLGMMGSASVVFIQGGARSIYERFRRTGGL